MPAVSCTPEELDRVRDKLERLLNGELAFEPHDCLQIAARLPGKGSPLPE